MDLLRMVINDQRKGAALLETAAINPISQVEGLFIEANVRMKEVLDRNERISQRRNKLLYRIVAFEIKVDTLSDEIQMVKGKYKLL